MMLSTSLPSILRKFEISYALIVVSESLVPSPIASGAMETATTSTHDASDSDAGMIRYFALYIVTVYAMTEKIKKTP